MQRKPTEPLEPPSLDVSSIIAAFSEEQVTRITSLSKGRLRYWAKTNFFTPSYVEDSSSAAYSRFYSFKDMVALKTLEILRIQNKVPLQHLRKVADKLSHLKDQLWTKTTLFVINREVIFVNPETGKPEAVLSGQYVMELPLTNMIEETKAEILKLRARREGTQGQVMRHKTVARNAWVIAGTRIPVSAIQRFHEDGYSADQIIEEYPDLTAEDIEAALQHGQTSAA
ncbi:DUF433 domain-containing protein [Prosthecomicrobium sp. N25]|uniref:DUF433 domain-containing protein n=1 Tax=Prosthecomicrobium sp. N25 TaxID=3129254 RepID=UPI0030778A3B